MAYFGKGALIFWKKEAKNFGSVSVGKFTCVIASAAKQSIFLACFAEKDGLLRPLRNLAMTEVNFQTETLPKLPTPGVMGFIGGTPQGQGW